MAGPAALLISKTHKLHERLDTPARLAPKDAHDIYRLLLATETQPLAETLRALLTSPIAAGVTSEAIDQLSVLFANPGSAGARLAGQAEAEIGEPDTVSVAVSALVADLLRACE